MTEELKTDIEVIFVLTLVHFVGDFYMSFVIPLLPLFVQKFSLTLTQVGLITGISRFLAFVVQPPVGYIADHHKTRAFVLGGPLLAIVFVPLIGLAPSFVVLIILISLGSIGSSMFHPASAGMVSAYAGRNFGFSMSIFNAGGTIAFGLGPLFITYFVGTYGLRASPFTMILGLAIMLLLFRVVPLPKVEGLTNLGFFSSIKDVLGAVWKSIALIWVVMVLRSFVGQSFLTFIPVLFAKEGYSLVSIGAIVSIFTVAGAISGLLAGRLSDRFGYKPLFYATHGLATPSLYLLLFLPSKWVYLGVFLSGFFVLATMPLAVAMAQELAPRGRSMVSSLMMGFAFGAGGMMTALAGKLADIFSIRPVLASLAIIPLLTTGLIALVHERKPSR
ncbi:MAG: MFS transporter [Desulfobacteraceae bacterium 4484_190.2]|nr:MAG: MFS transporter [Desulfobacteraceae bacterium 4484_190.2]